MNARNYRNTKADGRMLARLVAEKGLGEGEYVTLRNLHDRLNENGEGHATIGDLRAERLAGETTVRARLRELERVGLVWTERPPKPPARLTMLPSRASDSQPAEVPNDGRCLYLVPAVATAEAIRAWEQRRARAATESVEPTSKNHRTRPAKTDVAPQESATRETDMRRYSRLREKSGDRVDLTGDRALVVAFAEYLNDRELTDAEIDLIATVPWAQTDWWPKNKAPHFVSLPSLASYFDNDSKRWTWRPMAKIIEAARAKMRLPPKPKATPSDVLPPLLTDAQRAENARKMREVLKQLEQEKRAELWQSEQSHETPTGRRMFVPTTRPLVVATPTKRELEEVVRGGGATTREGLAPGGHPPPADPPPADVPSVRGRDRANGTK